HAVRALRGLAGAARRARGVPARGDGPRAAARTGVTGFVTAAPDTSGHAGDPILPPRRVLVRGDRGPARGWGARARRGAERRRAAVGRRRPRAVPSAGRGTGTAAGQRAARLAGRRLQRAERRAARGPRARGLVDEPVPRRAD